MARRSYAAFVLDGIRQGRRDDLYKARASGRILGADHFIEGVLAQAEEHAGKRMLLDGIVAVVCSVFAVDEAGLLTPGRKQMPSRMRGVIGLLVQETGDASLTDVAKRFGRDLSSISRKMEWGQACEIALYRGSKQYTHMARKPRLYLPGALYHVMLRGNDRQVIFHDDKERQHFLGLVSEGVGRYRHRIHAFCLMGMYTFWNWFAIFT